MHVNDTCGSVWGIAWAEDQGGRIQGGIAANRLLDVGQTGSRTLAARTWNVRAALR
jgi:hypothetical protein